MLTTSLLVLLAVILILVRLPSFFRTQNISQRDRVIILIALFLLLGAAVLGSKVLGLFIH
jgi:hypothetical protein